MKKEKKKVVYIIDDQPIYSEIIKVCLENTKADVYTFTRGEDAVNSSCPKPDIVVLDFELDDGSGENDNGLAVLHTLKVKYPEVEVVMLSAHDNVTVATSALKGGAFDYVVKNENAIINLKNRVSNMLSKINAFQERLELTLFKKRLYAVFAVTAIFTVVAEMYFPG